MVCLICVSLTVPTETKDLVICDSFGWLLACWKVCKLTDINWLRQKKVLSIRKTVYVCVLCEIGNHQYGSRTEMFCSATVCGKRCACDASKEVMLLALCL